ncbi:16S rRNA (cytosine(967)-C(5))-methyltransferase [Leptolyngbya ohadii]|uniref:16S rRNA (cytosine(967)-C(5))-methyltransferase n=1 Tax=Leptolyngbya ohadii TaxID=1962290 RepID=UPI000B59F9E5|nr:16S rRNA (cytosine(967)-C(5))-methyltransferase [Leptolyngbya ohadii]
MVSARQLAFLVLRSIGRGAFADIAVDRVLQRQELSSVDRRFVTELVYGTVRRQRTLDAIVDDLATKKSHQQPEDLRLILHLGLYQLRYLDQIPASAAVNTTVDLAKQNGFSGLSGFVNGLLRQYLRLSQSNPTQIPTVPEDPIARLGIQHSYPDWIVQVWADEFGLAEAEKLCEWFNRSPQIDLRVNRLRSSVAEVQSAMESAGISIMPVPPIPTALRLPQGVGTITQLPGYTEGFWSVQDSSAQLVSELLDPQPGETVIDACAAPGGKTTHSAERMDDRGTIWAIDRYASRLKKLQQNADRLQLQSIHIRTGDSRDQPDLVNQADRVLLDAPCSGLGTLHRHADARWRQTPDTVKELSQLQAELLQAAASWTKVGGVLVYATCTLHPAENEAIVQSFLQRHSQWAIEPPAQNSLAATFALPQGWLKVLPHHHNMDGFFMVRLRRQG